MRNKLLAGIFVCLLFGCSDSPTPGKKNSQEVLNAFKGKTIQNIVYHNENPGTTLTIIFQSGEVLTLKSKTYSMWVKAN